MRSDEAVDAAFDVASLYRYWGKAGDVGGGGAAWHPLILHNLDVAAVAVTLLDTDDQIARRLEALSPVPLAELRALIAFFASIHDLGKFSRVFQSKRPDVCERTGIALWGRECTYDVGHHTNLGLRFWQLFEDDFAGGFGLYDGEVFEPFCNVAFGHHGAPLDDGTKAPQRFDDATRDDAQSWLTACSGLFLSGGMAGFPSVHIDNDWDSDTFTPCSWLVAGLFVLADWIGSNDVWFPYVQSCPPFPEYWADACAKARRALSQTGILPVASSTSRSFSDILPHMPTNATPHPMQQAVLDLPPQTGPELLICEDLTGGGKTESAVLAAHRAMRTGMACGLYVGLPTMATANAMYARLAETYRALFASPEVSLVAAHGGRLLNSEFMKSIEGNCEYGEPLAPIGLEDVPARPESSEDAGAVCSSWIADNRKKSLLAPCGAGTLDQALLGVLPSKHQSLRLYGLARSVLIADEIHAYDEYTARLLERLLTFHAAFGGTAVLLSATLPHAMRSRFIAAWAEGRALAGASVDGGLPLAKGFPLLTRVTDEGPDATEIGATRTLDVAVLPVHDEDAMFDALAKAHKAGACACWIRNTVDDALAARQGLIDECGIPEDKVTLFHARYAGCDRAVIEGNVLSVFGRTSTPKVREGRILIATQVAEQSLDLDFDLMLSDLAPMELMIQRAGRCHRHKRDGRPAGYDEARMLVLMPQPCTDAGPGWYAAYFDKGQYVYPNHAMLWRTARLLADKGRLVLPRDARELVEGAYTGDAPQGLSRKDDEALGERYSKQSMAGFVALEFEDGYCRAGDGMKWDKDTKTPTRLGDETRQLRLVAVEEGGLRLWADKRGGWTSMKACLASELRVNAWKVAEVDVPRDVQKPLEAFAEQMPDKGRWCTLVPLERLESPESNIWTATVRNGKDETIEIYYGPDGLSFGDSEE